MPRRQLSAPSNGMEDESGTPDGDIYLIGRSITVCGGFLDRYNNGQAEGASQVAERDL